VVPGMVEDGWVTEISLGLALTDLALRRANYAQWIDKIKLTFHHKIHE